MRRDGYSARIALGSAWRLNRKFAASIEIDAVKGRYDIGATASNNDYRGLGATAGLGYKIAPNLIGQISGFYNYVWVDTAIGAATGNYTASIYGLTAGLSGTIKSGDM